MPRLEELESGRWFSLVCGCLYQVETKRGRNRRWYVARVHECLACHLHGRLPLTRLWPDEPIEPFDRLAQTLEETFE